MPGVVESFGATPRERVLLFYCVCFPLRILLASLLYKFHSTPVVQGFVGVASALSSYTLLLSLNTSNSVWWSRKFHLITSVLTFLLVIGGRTSLVPMVMIVDVLYGLSTSFAREPWTLK